MNHSKITSIIKWTAWIYGGIVVLIPIIALFPLLAEDRVVETDWRTVVLLSGLIIGLLLAYKWELNGGLIALVSLLISGFIHPLILPAPIIYLLYWFLKKYLKKSNT